ncbi:MAG: hypothetical protein AMXMBFR33_12010 [Candidatus Xenobia bacterium]
MAARADGRRFGCIAVDVRELRTLERDDLQSPLPNIPLAQEYYDCYESSFPAPLHLIDDAGTGTVANRTRRAAD